MGWLCMRIVAQGQGSWTPALRPDIIVFMQYFRSESLSHDPIHGYIPFTSPAGLPAGEVSEQQIIDHPWIQRLRQIHQLQTAWWVFPTAEHTRFQHVLGAMHLASRVVGGDYDSLREVCPDVPSRGYVESLMRMAALLHDVGHGPFGHFFDEPLPGRIRLNHEIVGSRIIRDELGDLIRGVRRNPNSRLADGETLDPRADLLPDHRGPTAPRPPTARSGCASCAACSAACIRWTTWISCSATPTCRATASGPSTSTACCATACSPPRG